MCECIGTNNPFFWLHKACPSYWRPCLMFDWYHYDLYSLLQHQHSCDQFAYLSRYAVHGVPSLPPPATHFRHAHQCDWWWLQFGARQSQLHSGIWLLLYQGHHVHVQKWWRFRFRVRCAANIGWASKILGCSVPNHVRYINCVGICLNCYGEYINEEFWVRAQSLFRIKLDILA